MNVLIDIAIGLLINIVSHYIIKALEQQKKK